MRSLIREWSGEAVITSYDRPTDTWVFITIHSTLLGPAMGGCRMHVYPTPEDGLRDAMRLAEAMTYKWAIIGFPLGGGKSVLALPRPLHGPEREALLRRFGRRVESLHGLYACGPDLGTTPQDMALIRQETGHVHGVTDEGRRTIDPGPFTALGVFGGIRAAVRQVFGDGELSGRTVLIQGVGDVGAPLARLLHEAGARLLLADLDQERVLALARALGGDVVAPDRVYETPCDVYAPCAVSGIVNHVTIPRFRCRIVAGSANTQLGEPSDADRLHERGILYAPDYVINAGGATALPLLGRGGHTEDQVRERVRRIEDTLTEIFTIAASREESPLHEANRRVEAVLAQRRGG